MNRGDEKNNTEKKKILQLIGLTQAHKLDSW